MIDRCRQAAVELVLETRIVRIQVDLDIRRVTVLVLRLDREEPERYEVRMEREA